MMENRSSTRSSRRNKTFKGGVLFLVSIYLLFAVFFDHKSAVTERSLGSAQVKTPTSKRTLVDVNDPNHLSAWVVIYDHFARNQGETEIQMLSYEMFHNREIYQKVLYVWDSSQADDLDYLNRYVPESLRNDIITIDVATEMGSHADLKADFAASHLSNNCFGRGIGYCEMLYIKMNLDIAVRAAAAKYEIEVPEILGIADGDAYWESLPVKENVIDPSGKIIFHSRVCDEFGRVYAPGVQAILPVGNFVNGMVHFPIHIWMDTLPAMRQKIVEIAHKEEEKLERDNMLPATFAHVFARKLDFSSEEHSRKLEQDESEESEETFLDIYLKNPAPVCEFCVMATYASIFEADRYRLTQAPCPFANKVIAPSNAFLDASSDPLPMVNLMRHEKAGGGPTNPFWPSTLNIWVYGCCLTYNITADENPICEDKIPDGYKELAGCVEVWYEDCGYTSPTLLMDHFERVHAAVERRCPEENAESKAVCLRHLEAIAEPYSRCETC